MLAAVLVVASAATCTPLMQRCAGSTGYPVVPWLSCCAGSCIEDSFHGWGRWCIDSTASISTSTVKTGKSVASTCTKTPVNHRCAGAPGHPAVPWLGCCAGSCVDDPSRGWGKWCVDGSAPVSTPTPVAKPVASATCTKTPLNQRCKGAVGYPAVPWRDGCCSPGTCVKAPSRGWGSWCVDTSASTSASGTARTTTVVATTTKTATRRSANAGVCGKYGRRVRQNINNMTVKEIKRFTDAVNTMHRKIETNGCSIFENFSLRHKAAYRDAHFSAYFLPWHRVHVFEFETALNDAAIADGGPPISLPYWDFTTHSTDFTKDPVWTKMGGAKSGLEIPDPPFKGWRSNGFVTRKFDNKQGTSQLFVTAKNIEQLVSPAQRSFQTFSEYLEDVHGPVHNGIGGSMFDPLTAADDPIFYAYHSAVDRIWRRWQKNGGGNKFGGLDVDYNFATIDYTFATYPGLSVNDILETISGCVEYDMLGSSAHQLATGVKDASFSYKLSTLVRQAFDNSTVIKFESVESKREAQLEAAKVKAEDPARAIAETLQAVSVEESTVSAMRAQGYPEKRIDRFRKSYRAIELMNAVDVSPKAVDIAVQVDTQLASLDVVKKEGKADITALQSSDKPAHFDNSDVRQSSNL
jgi:Common central domain of tyrosinase